jgi:hypothetical protein
MCHVQRPHGAGVRPPLPGGIKMVPPHVLACVCGCVCGCVCVWLCELSARLCVCGLSLALWLVSNKFTFDRVFGMDSTQAEVYDFAARPVVEEALKVRVFDVVLLSATLLQPIKPTVPPPRCPVRAGLQLHRVCVRPNGKREDAHHDGTHGPGCCPWHWHGS